MSRRASLLVFLAACGSTVASPVFHVLYPDNRTHDVETVISRLPAPSDAPVNRTGKAIVVAASAKNVVAWDLVGGRALWKKAHVARSRPIVTARAVVFLEGEDVVALDVATGRKLWSVAVEENFLGASGDDSRVFLVFGTAVAPTAPVTERRAGVLVAVRARDGDDLWRLETDRQLGAPAVVGDLVFLPWDRQYLSAIETPTGKEVARIRQKDDSILFVTSFGGRVHYGSRGVYRLEPGSASGTQEGAVYLPPPTKDLPGDPRAWSDGFIPPEDDAAAEHIRLYVRPSGEGEAIAPADDVSYYLFFKYVFGLAPDGGAVRWATRLEHESLAAMPLEGGLMSVMDSGDVVWLDAATGDVRWRASIGETGIRSAAFDVGAFHPEASEPAEPRVLRAALLEIANDRDNRLVPARAFAVQALGKIEGAEVTADLLEVLSHREVPQVIRDAAGEALLGRRAGSDKILDVVETHHDYLAGKAAPPIAPLAKALASIRELRAVPHLLSHLEDPATDREALPEIAEALGEMGDRRAVAPLDAFVVRYHADDALGARPAATKAAVTALVKIGGRPERRRLAELADDPFTLPDLRDHIRFALEPPPPVVEEAAPTPAAAAATTAPGPQAEGMAPDYELPLRLGPADISRAMTKATPALRQCLGRDDPDHVRLVFVVRSEGGIDHVNVQPENETLRACLADKLTRVEFGRFRESRQQVNWQVDRAAPAKAPTKAPAKRPPTKRP